MFRCENERTIALYFQRLGRQGGGAERMLCHLANALSKRGYRVHVITWDASNARSFYPLAGTICWHKLGYTPGLTDKFRRVLALRRVLVQNKIGKMIGFVMSGDMTVYAAALSSRTRILAAERNGPSMYLYRYPPLRRRLNFLLLGLARRITVQCPSFVSGYPKQLQSRISVIPNPVQLPEETANQGSVAPSGRFRILFVGRLDSIQKRPLLLAQAFARIAHDFSNWEVVFVGDGPERQAIDALRLEVGLGDRIILRPTTVRIEEEYLAAHLFVIPSLWEGFPNVLAEAMAHGLPAIGFAGAEGVSDLISFESGWLVTAEGDPVQALSNALRQAISDAGTRARCAAASRLAVSAFEQEAVFDQWSKTIDELSQ